MNIMEKYHFFEQDAKENLAVDELTNVAMDQQWANYLKWDNIIHNKPDTQDISAMDVQVDEGEVAFLQNTSNLPGNNDISVMRIQESLLPHSVTPEYLNEKQCLAFCIVYKYLGEHYADLKELVDMMVLNQMNFWVDNSLLNC